MNERSIRFGIQDGKGLQGSTWKCWTPGKGLSDVYLACRSLGHIFKASLHQSGSWQFGYSKEYWDEHKEDMPTERTIRHLEVWKRPKEIEKGLTLAYRVITPCSSVNIVKENTSAVKQVVWIPNSPQGWATEVDILLASSNTVVSGWPGKKSMNTGLVGSFILDSKEVIWIVHHKILMPSKPALKVKPEFFKGHGPEDIKGRNLRALAFGIEPDGSRTFYDFIFQGA